MLILSMLIFGSIGIFRKYILLPSSMIALARGIIGTLFLLCIILLKRDKIPRDIIKKNLLPIIISGGMIGFNWILLFESYRYTTVAAATLCYYMAPIIVIFLAPIITDEKLSLKKILCSSAAVIGMILVSGVAKQNDTASNDTKGILFGLGAALLYASIILLNKKIKNVPALWKTTLQLGSAAVVILPYTLLTENLSSLTFSVYSILMLIFVGILHTGIAYILYFASMEKLKAQTIALFSYIDPITAILLSALLLRENTDIFSIIGAVMILGSTMICELPDISQFFSKNKNLSK